MRFSISSALHANIVEATRHAISDQGIVNVPVVANRILGLNLHENVALEDIERRVLETAQMFRAAIEFDSEANPDMLPGVAAIVTVMRE